MKQAARSPLIPPSVTWRKTGEEAVILNLETSEYYSANETGTFVWELLAAGRKPARIAEELAAEYGVSAEDAAGDVGRFIKDLVKLKILPAEAAE